MLTIFSMPKAFHGTIGIAQRNAIHSWLRLHNNVQVILFGKDDGIAETCAQLGLCHVEDVATWPHGTRAPLHEEVFSRVESLARHRLLCFVCADIIFLSDVIAAVRQVSVLDRFVLTGRRYDIHIDRPLDFTNLAWEQDLRQSVIGPTQTKGMDYYVYPKGMWGKIPPFITGRPYPDSWSIYRALQLGAPVIDATERIMPLHQLHPIGSAGGTHAKDELAWNRKLAGAGVYFNQDDSTHVLTSAGLRAKPLSLRAFARRVDSLFLLRSPALYATLTLATFRRARSLRHMLARAGPRAFKTMGTLGGKCVRRIAMKGRRPSSI